MSKTNTEYSKGYQAGRKRGYQDGYDAGLSETNKDIPADVRRRDALMVQTLPTILERCNGWSVGGEKINDAEGYVTLTRIFVDHMIKPNN